MCLLILIASISTRSFGIFTQKRIGQFGKPFLIFKIRSMKINQTENTFTSLSDERITSFGSFIRKYKLDELPQLFNVLVGTMSLVGPRPDVPEIINQLNTADKAFLLLKPGLLSLATLTYLNEEELLSKASDPITFYLNDIWPKKVKMNLEYLNTWNNYNDVKIMLAFIKKVFR